MSSGGERVEIGQPVEGQIPEEPGFVTMYFPGLEEDGRGWSVLDKLRIPIRVSQLSESLLYTVWSSEWRGVSDSLLSSGVPHNYRWTPALTRRDKRDLKEWVDEIKHMEKKDE